MQVETLAALHKQKKKLRRNEGFSKRILLLFQLKSSASHHFTGWHKLSDKLAKIHYISGIWRTWSLLLIDLGYAKNTLLLNLSTAPEKPKKDICLAALVSGDLSYFPH